MSNPIKRKTYDFNRKSRGQFRNSQPPQEPAAYSKPEPKSSHQKPNLSALADSLERLSTKLNGLREYQVDKGQLTDAIDSVLNDKMAQQILNINDAQSNARIIEVIIRMFKFLDNNEIENYSRRLVRIAGSNIALVKKINKAEKNGKKWHHNLNLPVWIMIVVIFVLVSVFAFIRDEYFTKKPETTVEEAVPAEVYEEEPLVSKYSGNQLTTGASPYNNYFGKGVASDLYLNEIEVKNGQTLDAIVCLTDYTTEKTIRNEYIRAGDRFVMRNVPDGTYYLKTFYGINWNPDTILFSGRLRGYFDTNSGFSISDEYDDLIVVNQTSEETNEGEIIHFSQHTITLYPVTGGNMESRPANINEFFK